MVGLRESAIEKLDQGCTNLEYYLHKTASYPVTRWVGTTIFGMSYGIRVFYFLHGFYFVTCMLLYAIVCTLFDGVLKLWVPPEAENSDAPILPIKDSDEEFKPFVPVVPEFTFWRIANVLILIAFVITLFPVFTVTDAFFNCANVICCTIVLFLLCLISNIAHMKKYKYMPFTVGKKKYGGKKHVAVGTD